MSPFILILRGLALFLQTLFAALPLNISFSPHNTESWCLKCPTPFNPLPGQSVSAHCARGPGAGQGQLLPRDQLGGGRPGRAWLPGRRKILVLGPGLGCPRLPMRKGGGWCGVQSVGSEDLPSTTGYYNTAATRGAGFLLYRDHPEHSITTSATRSRHPAASAE